MTSVPARLAAYAVVLAVVFGGAALAGGAVDPDGAEPAAPHGAPAPAHGADDAAHGDGATPQPRATTGGEPGLAVSHAGLRLVLDDPQRARPGRVPLRLRIVDERDEPVRDFALEHDKRLHLIVVRRDLRGFVHLHPALDADGTWTASADLPRAGSYRVFADFRPEGGEKMTLGSDLHLGGDFTPEALPAPSETARTDSGLEVRLRRDGDRVGFAVLRDGRPVDAELQPYLGAKGHLVTLRDGDLAYLHTHPDGDRLAFEAHLPTPGRYRMWVQFSLDGEVHTAAFTVEEEA